MKMKRSLGILALALALPLFGFGCSSLESTARDTLATNFGLIIYAQSQYQTTCSLNPTQTVCQLVTKDIPAHNAAIDALEEYCAGIPAAGVATFANGGPCAPIKGLASTLQAAIAALGPIMTDLKPLINPGAVSPAPAASNRSQFQMLEAGRL